MKSLYNPDNASPTKECCDLNEATLFALRDIFKKYVADGYSPRDISHAMMGMVFQLEVSEVSRKRRKL